MQTNNTNISTTIPTFMNTNTTNPVEVEKIFTDNLFWETSGLLGILTRCCTAFGVSVDAVKSRSRIEQIVFARQAYCYIASRRTEQSLASIGKLINRDHSTVSVSVNKVRGYLKVNYKHFTDTYNMLLND